MVDVGLSGPSTRSGTFHPSSGTWDLVPHADADTLAGLVEQIAASLDRPAAYDDSVGMLPKTAGSTTCSSSRAQTVHGGRVGGQC